MKPSEEDIREPQTLRYRYSEPEEAGTASLAHVSRAGVTLRLGRYLRPGRQVWLSFVSPLDPGTEVEVRAQVTWCRPARQGLEFLAGLCVLRDDPGAALAFAAWGCPSRESKPDGDVRETNRIAARGVLGLWWPSLPETRMVEELEPAAQTKAV
jgi:hypothetical protein